MERGQYHGNQYQNMVSANLPIPPISQPEAADMLNVSERTLRTVKAVEREAPELIPQMEAGKMSANEAYKEGTLWQRKKFL